MGNRYPSAFRSVFSLPHGLLVDAQLPRISYVALDQPKSSDLDCCACLQAGTDSERDTSRSDFRQIAFPK